MRPEKTNHALGRGYLNYIFRRLRKSPHLIIPALAAWLTGWKYRIIFFLRFKRFSAGRYFRIYGKFNVSGPGTVRFGDNCLIISNGIKPVCIRTLTPDATITVGDSVGLNGTSIQCAKEIGIGALSAIADAFITDTTAHSVHKNRRAETIEDADSVPTKIGSNVWISVNVVVLHGVTIGDNSVIGACSLVRDSVPSSVMAAGIPLRILRKITAQDGNIHE